ncbi:IS4 family transposase, partial [Arthrobacter sp. NPDC058192]|uniref:IS4 family transposase n=1 Tax=Arthrobacter sp. NPDC058192 TaxID=3346372 RepID=UPI0036F0B904
QIHTPIQRRHLNLSVLDKQVIRQCLSYLPLQDFIAPLLDYRKQLKTVNLLKIFITGQLLAWDSLGTIAKTIRSDEAYQSEFGINSIDKSQLSRRMLEVPLEVTQALFAAVVAMIQAQASQASHMNHNKLLLALVDSTSLRMPPKLGDWAYVTKKQNSVKVHTRLLVVDKQTAYPDQIIASTGNIGDYEGSDQLVVDPGVLYVMDRGYVCYKRMEKWAAGEIDFVVRIANHHCAEVLSERNLPADEPRVMRDATVLLGNQPQTRMKTPVRLIEYKDEQERFYRIATTRHDLSAAELMEVYRNRWLIELFFKWLKQHLKFAKLYSYQPEAVWNHIYLALVAYGLAYYVKQKVETKQSIWQVTQWIRIYAVKPWERLLNEMERKPSKRSKGSRKKGPPDPIKLSLTPGVIIRQPKKRNR